MKTIFLSIDFINEIVHPKGKIAACAPYIQANNTIESANYALKTGRKLNIPIIQVKVGFSADYRECPKNSPIFGKASEYRALQLGTWGTEFHETLDTKESDYVITKHRVSCLYGTDLEIILRAQNIQRVVIFGVSTNMAIETITRELHDRDYQLVVVEDACASVSDDVQKASIATLSRLATITTAKQLEKVL